jgi:hypothetical protein
MSSAQRDDITACILARENESRTGAANDPAVRFSAARVSRVIFSIVTDIINCPRLTVAYPSEYPERIDEQNRDRV